MNTYFQDLTASIRSFTPKFGITVPDYSFMSYNTQREENVSCIYPASNSRVTAHVITDLMQLWEYSRSGLIYMKELGEGQFGKVLLMKAHVSSYIATPNNFPITVSRVLQVLLAHFQWL